MDSLAALVETLGVQSMYRPLANPSQTDQPRGFVGEK